VRHCAAPASYAPGANGRQVHCSLDRNRYQECLQRLETLVDPSIQFELLLSGTALIEAEAMLEEVSMKELIVKILTEFYILLSLIFNLPVVMYT